MIVSAETGGLGNRIKSWVSAMRIDPAARVYWPLTKNMPARFDSLFESGNNIDEIPPEADVYASWRLAVNSSDAALVPRRFAVVGGGSHPIIRAAAKRWWHIQGRPSDRFRYMVFAKKHSRSSARKDGRNIDFEYGRIPESMRSQYRPLFKSVRFNKQVSVPAAQWWQQHGGENIVGVQIRTWRDDPRRHKKYYLPSTKRFNSLLSTIENQKLFVVSDSDETVAELRERLGAERVLSFPRETKRIDSWKSTAGVQEDLIDMLLLSRAQRIFASYMSTFSETAWWLGGAGAEVDVF